MIEIPNYKIDEITDEDLRQILNVDTCKINYSILNRINKAKEEKPMKKLFGTYLNTGEISIIAGDTGAGKTILGFQLADSVTKGISILEQDNEEEPQIVLYYDFELSNQSLLKRFPDYHFNENFHCPDINDLLLAYEGIFSVEIIRDGLNTTGASVVFIDNISAISLKSTQDQDTALYLMKELKILNLEKGVTFLIFAHTPKIPNNIPLNINHITGSKHLTNYCDNVSIIGKSSQQINRRYLKQLKSRNDEMQDRVIILDILHQGYLQFQFAGYDIEKNHLFNNPQKEEEKKNKLKEILLSYFDGNDLGYSDFCNEYSKRTGLTFERARQVHKELKYYNLIIQNPNNKKWMINLNEIS